ncbi:hypothetical protein LOK49_LG07G01202 [Camellia lanceoleosa]|uniref:Uncharacterized protein n=1 Tax=Camellia lanceoleosa TaxID=1840588 RepID=A0ACC0H5X0_9ERIC|nr:hypothetical protein LOK49_LG07G01202 [Camellia lanceoleosa]
MMWGRVVGRRSWLWERERGLEVARTNGEHWHWHRAWKANGNGGKPVKMVDMERCGLVLYEGCEVPKVEDERLQMGIAAIGGMTVLEMEQR